MESRTSQNSLELDSHDFRSNADAMKDEMARVLVRDVMAAIDRVLANTQGLSISAYPESGNQGRRDFIQVIVTAFRNDLAGHGMCSFTPGSSGYVIEEKIRKQVAIARNAADEYDRLAQAKALEGVDLEAELKEAEAFSRLEAQFAEAVALRPNGVTFSEACHHPLLRDFDEVAVKQILDGLVDEGRLACIFKCVDGLPCRRWFASQPD